MADTIIPPLLCACILVTIIAKIPQDFNADGTNQGSKPHVNCGILRKTKTAPVWVLSFKPLKVLPLLHPHFF
ncbi:MAG: hypothetical protein IIV87_01005, partial [Oscillospiraceae bacterium]|nr:hypothetical protein [Oscillospiraceae bacterium]